MRRILTCIVHPGIVHSGKSALSAHDVSEDDNHLGYKARTSRIQPQVWRPLLPASRPRGLWCRLGRFKDRRSTSYGLDRPCVEHAARTVAASLAMAMGDDDRLFC